MKNILEYYYHFANISLHYSDGVYYFEKEGQFYILKEIKRQMNEIMQIYQLLLRFPSFYHKIILNKDGSIVTGVDQKSYILLRILEKNKNKISMEQFLSKEKIIVDRKAYSLLYRLNWGELWAQKVDYFEYQMSHIEKKYPLLSASIFYYIGLAENAISYVEDTNFREKKEMQDTSVISHIRMYADVSITEFYDPLSIILDHPARDVAGYLKGLFFDNSYQLEEIEYFLKNLSFSKYGYRLLFARLLYPSYYFDLYEQIILGLKEEKEIKRIIKQSEAYRDYLRQIYLYINKIVEIPKVDWI